ncbi:MAG: isoleucine--tRNA ligase [Candidatus Aenigmarchaeota archaeon]|nr:isoleucine--tRNA ligase [Candidatus Aenigmarchaeota archaeon]
MYNPKEIEKKVQKIWHEKGVAETIVQMDWKRKKFYLLDGPPYVNGMPHVGHVKTTTFKDIWGKFKYMQGFSVWFQPGFDCGGLPIENEVEKGLGVKSKSDIEEKIGIDKFIDECKKFAKGNEPVWINLYKKMGVWRGWVKPYLTSENYYLESGWWTVKQWFEKGLLIEGKKPGFWCPRCETVLSGYEVSDSYKTLEDPSIFIKFPVKGRKEYLLVWTTTPWTLAANVAIVAHPDEIYVKAKVGDDILIIAEKRLEELEKIEMDYQILEKFPGKKLERMGYDPVLKVPQQEKLKKNKNAHQVLLSVPVMKKRVAGKIKAKKMIEDGEEFGHMVTMDTGTGLVHTAPGHGDVDNKIGKYYNLPEPSPVNEKGELTAEAGDFAGLFVKNADEKIIDALRAEGLLLHSSRITHSYPLCWRCKTPLIYRMSRQWFLKLDTIREKIIKENKKVNWLPEFARERYHNLITESPDWAVTRQRYWGIPFPVWICASCRAKKVMESLDELKKESGSHVKDLYKNTVDRITLKCECGGEMAREKDIMDVWFDSGISPWASLGYPGKNKELFEKLWTVDLIDESSDQIRGWFHTLMLCSMATFGTKPYETVCLNGWTLDEKGEKMSKSLGNVVSAEDAYNKLGADLLRLYYCYDIAPWETQKFSMKNAKELGKSVNIFWNVYNYFKTYTKLETKAYELQIEDMWILSKLNSLIKSTTDDLENFRFHVAGRCIVEFIVNDLSRTYIKLVRERNDRAVNFTLTETLTKLTKLMAPITPFVAEYVFYDLYGKSVHTEKWPKHDEKAIDKKLEEQMIVAEEIVTMTNSIRKDHDIKLRWPLPGLTTDAKMDKKLCTVVERLANVEKVRLGTPKAPQRKGEISVELITKADEDLALLHELTREIQKKRKEMGLVVSEEIALVVDNKKLKKYEKEIKEKVGAESIEFKDVRNPSGAVSFKKASAKFWLKKL